MGFFDFLNFSCPITTTSVNICPNWKVKLVFNRARLSITYINTLRSHLNKKVTTRIRKVYVSKLGKENNKAKLVSFCYYFSQERDKKVISRIRRTASCPGKIV